MKLTIKSKHFNNYQEYTYADIEYRETKIREQLLNSGHVSKSMKRDLIVFLNSAKQKFKDSKKRIAKHCFIWNILILT